MRMLFFSLSLALLCACQPPETKLDERPVEDQLITVKTSDDDVNEAIRQAQKTLGEFSKKLRQHDSTEEGFALKVRFKTPDDGGEHMWMRDITEKNGVFTGIVANDAESTKEVAYGDTVKIVTANISDWMYIDNGKLRGGYTIRALARKLSPEDKKRMEAESGFKIED